MSFYRERTFPRTESVPFDTHGVYCVVSHHCHIKRYIAGLLLSAGFE